MNILTVLNRQASWKIYTGAIIFFSIFYFILPPFAQYESYHNFAGDAFYKGIPNFLNIVSNLFFCIAGAVGLYRLNTQTTIISKKRWQFFYSAIFFVGIGSGYYHYQPTTYTLFWDRLPMSIGFAALTANFLGERYASLNKRSFFWIIQLFSVYSVLYWILSELAGQGDLRLYGIVQFATIGVIATVLIRAPNRLLDRPYWILFMGYALSKVFEMADFAVYYQSIELVGGHVLKHVAAGAALCFFFPR